MCYFSIHFDECFDEFFDKFFLRIFFTNFFTNFFTIFYDFFYDFFYEFFDEFLTNFLTNFWRSSVHTQTPLPILAQLCPICKNHLPWGFFHLHKIMISEKKEVFTQLKLCICKAFDQNPRISSVFEPIQNRVSPRSALLEAAYLEALL